MAANTSSCCPAKIRAASTNHDPEVAPQLTFFPNRSSLLRLYLYTNHWAFRQFFFTHSVHFGFEKSLDIRNGCKQKSLPCQNTDVYAISWSYENLCQPHNNDRLLNETRCGCKPNMLPYQITVPLTLLMCYACSHNLATVLPFRYTKRGKYHRQWDTSAMAANSLTCPAKVQIISASNELNEIHETTLS